MTGVLGFVGKTITVLSQVVDTLQALATVLKTVA
jgi:hypothetical protein